ncbi:MAG: succinyldiaminopimelate transaminase [Halothiobacillaceae bacterium]
MNPDLQLLHPYPFEKLARLKAGVTPPAERPHIPLSIGEPQHAPPKVATDALIAHLHGLASYPATRGMLALREAIARWLAGRFGLAQQDLDPGRHVLPVNGTREALFALAQAVVDRQVARPRVLMPNPFYQIYEGAALLAGAEPWYYPNIAENGFLPDFEEIPDEVWDDCQLIYVCSPGNPSGAVIDEARYRWLIDKAERHDFVIASDECYSELYADEDAPPVGLLQVAVAMGNSDFRRCVVFHSLSKRSNLPGLRSGFVAGDAGLLEAFLRYRTYHGCAMPPPAQHASIAAWSDEAHVRENRALYRQKFDAVLDILADVMPVDRPAAGFYLWAPTPEPDETVFARRLFETQNVTVLPGRYLSREVGGQNPGVGFVRMALVAELEDCIEAARRIRACCPTGDSQAW